MIVCKGSLNAYYPGPDKCRGVIFGSRRVTFYRGFLIVSPKERSMVRLSQGDSNYELSKETFRDPVPQPL
jgi:hypothetical protein